MYIIKKHVMYLIFIFILLQVYDNLFTRKIKSIIMTDETIYAKAYEKKTVQQQNLKIIVYKYINK